MNRFLLTELEAALVAGNLTHKSLLARTGDTPNLQILPQANVIKIGGQSFIDRGRSAVYPLIREIRQALPQHQMIIGTGAGTRARHAHSMGIEPGMPILAARSRGGPPVATPHRRGLSDPGRMLRRQVRHPVQGCRHPVHGGPEDASARPLHARVPTGQRAPARADRRALCGEHGGTLVHADTDADAMLTFVLRLAHPGREPAVR